MDLDAIRRLLRLRAEIRDADARLKELRAEEERLEEHAAHALVDAGVQNLNLDGATVYLSTQFYCGKRGERTQADAIEVVRSLGLDDFVEQQVQAARLKAWAHERIKAMRESNPAASITDALPQSFLDTFHAHERVSIGSRKSNNAGATKP